MEPEATLKLSMGDLMEHQPDLFLIDSFLEESLQKTTFLDFLLHLTANPNLYQKVRDNQHFWKNYSSFSSSQSPENWFDYVSDQALEDKFKFFNSKSIGDISSLKIDCRNNIPKEEYIKEIYYPYNDGIHLDYCLITEIQWWKSGELVTKRIDLNAEVFIATEIHPVLYLQRKDNCFFALSNKNKMYRIYMYHSQFKITPLSPNLFEDIIVKEAVYVERYFNRCVRLIFVLDSIGQLHIAYVNDLGVMLESRKQRNINEQLQSISHLELFQDSTLMVNGVKLFTVSGELYFLYLCNPLVSKGNTTDLSKATAVMEILEDIDNFPLTKIPFRQMCYVPHSNLVLLLDHDNKIFVSQESPHLEEIYQQKEPFQLKEGLTVKNFIVKDGDSIQWEFEIPRYVPYLYYLQALEKDEIRKEWMDRQFRYYQKKDSGRIYAAPIPSSSLSS